MPGRTTLAITLVAVLTSACLGPLGVDGCAVPPAPDQVDAPPGGRDNHLRFDPDETDVLATRAQIDILTDPGSYTGSDVPLDLTDHLETDGQTPRIVAVSQPDVGQLLSCDGQLTYRVDPAVAEAADRYLDRDGPGTATDLLPDDVLLTSDQEVRYCATVDDPATDSPVGCNRARITVYDPVQSALYAAVRADNPDAAPPALVTSTQRQVALDRGATPADIVAAERAMLSLWARYIAVNPMEAGMDRVLIAWACGGAANAASEGMAQGFEWSAQAFSDLELLRAQNDLTTGRPVTDRLPPLESLNGDIDVAAAARMLRDTLRGDDATGLDRLLGGAVDRDTADALAGLTTTATAAFEARLRDQHPDWSDDRIRRHTQQFGDSASFAEAVAEVARHGDPTTILPRASRELVSAACTTILQSAAAS